MRLDAHLDAAAAVARYMELLKLAAPDRAPSAPGGAARSAIAEINQLLTQARAPSSASSSSARTSTSCCSRREREKLRRRELIVAERAEPSLEAFLPMRGDGRDAVGDRHRDLPVCPLRYKFARVFSIPREQTLQQRFGILVHQVLERFHSQLANEEALTGGESLREPHAGHAHDAVRDRLAAARLRRLERGAPAAREGGRGARALPRALRGEEASPVWFERNFSFRIGPHLLRGRVDRVDRQPDGSYELIDYKTGRARTPSQLKDDIQLSLYQIGARESWQLDASRQSYYYVLDDEQVPLEPTDEDVIRDRRRPRSRSPTAILRAALRADAVVRGLLDLRLPAHLPRGRTVDAAVQPF